MTRIDDIFAAHRSAGTRALMPFMTAGYPTLDDTRATLPALQEAGASIVELGFPFSDPIADGPVIAASMYEALKQGVRPCDVFDMVRALRDELSLGLIAMVSDSIMARIGTERFVGDASSAGFDGLILPDIDLKDADRIRPIADKHGLSVTLLVAPNTTEARLKELVSRCTGFVYLLARVGITGESDAAPEIADRVALVRQFTNLPVAVGFGISEPEHVRIVTESADAAIVGSALVRRIGNAANPAEEAGRFVRSLASGLSHAASV